MIDDSSNRLVWVAVGLALIFAIFAIVNAAFPGIGTAVTGKITALVNTVNPS